MILISYALGLASVVTFGLAQISAMPVTIVPAVNLVAIIAGSITMGMLFNRVRELERRMDKTQRRVFHEDNPEQWDGLERRNRPTRK